MSYVQKVSKAISRPNHCVYESVFPSARLWLVYMLNVKSKNPPVNDASTILYKASDSFKAHCTNSAIELLTAPVRGISCPPPWL